MSSTIGGVEWITTGEICRRLAPDVGRDVVRGWWRAGLIRQLLGPDERPIRVPTGRRGGGEYLFAWPDVVEAERLTRSQGRPRAGHASNTPVPRMEAVGVGQGGVYR